MERKEKKHTPRKTRIELPYLPHQKQVFDAEERFVVYVKGRRAGGTKGAVFRLVEIAQQEHPGSRHLWVEPVHRNIAKLVSRYFRPLLEGTDFRWQASQRVLNFPSGSYCDFVSAQRPDLLAGFGYDYIWINEAGIVLQDPALFWETLFPMGAENQGARWFIIGSPKGPGLFQQMFAWGQADSKPDWKSFRHPSHVNTLLSRDMLAHMESHMPEREFRQEILAEFVESEGAFFREPRKAAQGAPETSGQPGSAYVIGVDLARRADYTVAWVARLHPRRGVWCERFKQTAWRQQISRLGDLSRRFNQAPLVVDATGAGDPVAEEMAAQGLPVRPVVITGAVRRQLLDRLAMELEQGRFTLFPHPETLEELENFRLTQGRPDHPSGSHDDCVFALALCVHALPGQGQGFILGKPMVSRELDV
ncbi:MAG: hypothetical protein OEV94_01860 [Deltaproteobacteria bacterium]|nr:hypothetical protein [Deltaproteobacteria bacterium]